MEDSEIARALEGEWEQAWAAYFATGKTVANFFKQGPEWVEEQPLATVGLEETNFIETTSVIQKEPAPGGHDTVMSVDDTASFTSDSSALDSDNTIAVGEKEDIITAKQPGSESSLEETSTLEPAVQNEGTATSSVNNDGRSEVQKLAQSFQILATQNVSQSHTAGTNSAQDQQTTLLKGGKIPPLVYKAEKPQRGSSAKKQDSSSTAANSTASNDRRLQGLQSANSLRTHLRKLVTVRRIAEIRLAQGLSAMVVATIDGWEVVVNKARGFKAGDHVVFIEIDAFLPASNPLFAKYNQTSFGGIQGHLVITQKFNKQISQGLIFHVRDFPEIEADEENWRTETGTNELPIRGERVDYAEMLGVVKFCLQGEKAANGIGRFPVWVQKADMECVQNIPQIFQHTKYNNPKMQFQESTKMDGSTMTCYYIRNDSQIYKSLPELENDLKSPSICKSGRFGVCSRNWDLRYRPGSLFWQAALHYGIRKKLCSLGRNLAIQGELVGSTIESNFHGYLDGEHEFFVFSVYDIDTHERWNPKEVETFAKEMGLLHVPVKGYFVLPSIGRNVEALVARAGGQDCEGLVYKNVFDGRWFKVISPDWLLRREVQSTACKVKAGLRA